MMTLRWTIVRGNLHLPALTVLLTLLLTGCVGDRDISGLAGPEADGAADGAADAPVDAPVDAASAVALASLADEVRAQAAARGIVPLGPPPPVRPALVELGQALLFDKILSGNRDISCMTCHHPAQATGDGRQLSIGQGATGVGPSRVHPDNVFIPRNAPPLFNLHTIDALFLDGRVARNPDGSFTTPAGDELTPAMADVFEFGAASALGLFPVQSHSEMRGDGRDNELSRIKDRKPQKIWKKLMKRLRKTPGYVEMFEAAYPGTKFQHMTFAHASNAMAGFLVSELSFNDSPWDRFLDGDDGALTSNQLEGADIFTRIKCSVCHNGSTFSDGKFHNVALAQLGPGQGDGPSGHDDFGRMRVTAVRVDRYAFRTSSLRNVELTGPYGHAGQFTKLRDFIDHYDESETKLRNYVALQGSNVEPLLRPTILTGNFDAIVETRSPIIEDVVFDDAVTDRLLDFMLALTDDRARNLSYLTPASVPSGLPVD